MSEVEKLKRALEFLTSHIPGANELAEVVNKGSLVLDTCHEDSPEDVLLQKSENLNDADKEQKMLDAFKAKNLNNLEVGRLYERYVGYLYENEGWSVTYKGIVDGLNDLGRDLICIKNNVHKVVQAKCWSKHTEIRENHIYQLFGSFTHYRMQLRQVFKSHSWKNQSERNDEKS